MRKVKYFLLLCLFAIITTGCVKFNGTMEIKKDKSMEFSIIYALDTSVFGEANKLKEEDFKSLKDGGYTVSEYSEGTMEGFKITKSIKNIDDVSTDKDVIYNLSGMMKGSEDNTYIFKVEKGLLKNTYTAVLKFDSNDSGLNTDDTKNATDDETETGDENLYSDESDLEEDLKYEYPEEMVDGTLSVASSEDVASSEETLDTSNLDYSSLMSGMDLSFNVKLPYGAISNNATTQEDGNKTLKWTLLSNKASNIEFKFAIYNMTIIYIGTGIILVIIVLAILLLMKKKGKKELAPIEDKPIELKDDEKETKEMPELKNEVNVETNEDKV